MTPTLLIRSAMLLVPEASPLRTQNVEMRRSRTHGRPCWFFSQHIQAQGTDCYEHVGWKPHQQTLTPRLKPKTLRCVVPHLSLSEKGAQFAPFSFNCQTRYGAFDAFPSTVQCSLFISQQYHSTNTDAKYQKILQTIAYIFAYILHIFLHVLHILTILCNNLQYLFKYFATIVKLSLNIANILQNIVKYCKIFNR